MRASKRNELNVHTYFPCFLRRSLNSSDFNEKFVWSNVAYMECDNVNLFTLNRSKQMIVFFFWVHDISTRIYATLLLSFPENQFSYLFVSVSVCLCRWLAAFNAHLQNSCEILQNRPVNFNYNRMTWAYFFPPASRTHAESDRQWIMFELLTLCMIFSFILGEKWFVKNKITTSRQRKEKYVMRASPNRTKIYNSFAYAI